jgi:hypothetical protein
MSLVCLLCCRSCNLSNRATTFKGTCLPAVPYIVNSKPYTEPYTCLSNNPEISIYPTGDDCTRQVDLQLDCGAICVCSEPIENQMDLKQGCNSADNPVGVIRHCSCDACGNIVPAEQDRGYQTVQDISLGAVAGQRKLQSGTAPSQAARRLHQVWSLASSLPFHHLSQQFSLHGCRRLALLKCKKCFRRAFRIECLYVRFYRLNQASMFL